MTPDPAADPALVRDVAHALVNTLLVRAAVVVEEGYATAGDVDLAMRLGCGLPVGPIELLRQQGTGVVRASLDGDPPTGVPLEDVAADLVGRWGAGESLSAALTRDRPSDAPRPASGPAVSGPAVSGSVAAGGDVGVLGSGTMAAGIAQVLAVAGFRTVLVARSQAKADAAVKRIADSLSRAEVRGKVSAETRERALARLEAGDDRASLRDCHLVVEAVVEDLAVKEAAFADLDTICGPGTILASTTSSLSVTRLATVTNRPSSVLGLHFFNPAPMMKLVEVVRTEHTGDDTWRTALAVCDRVGKTGVTCPDRTGFIVNHLLLPYLNDAVRALDRGGVGVVELDQAIETGFGYPMGPFRLLDTIGLDVSLTIQRELFAASGSPWLEPAPLLEELVGLGRLGRKTRTGFHDYE